MEFRPMSPEEIERTVQFLLGQQAQTAADFARLTDKTDRLADGLIGLVGIVGRIADQVARLAEAQLRTETRLDAVIDIMERRLREKDGPPPS